MFAGSRAINRSRPRKHHISKMVVWHVLMAGVIFAKENDGKVG